MATPLLLPLPALRRTALRRDSRNNLAHCFSCHRNLNNIDLLRALGHDFLSAVALLERLLNQHQAQQRK